MDGVELVEKRFSAWQVVILNKEFNVANCRNGHAARREGSILYNKKMKTDFPISFLVATARVRRLDDKRIKHNYSDGVPSLLELERKRRAFLVEAKEEEEVGEFDRPTEGRVFPKQIAPGRK